jgi:hypothetical protein
MSNAITSAEVSQGGHYNISNGSGDCSGDERDRGRYAGGVQVAAEEVVMVVWEIVVEEKDIMVEIMEEIMARMEEETAEEKQTSLRYCSL